MRISAVDLFAGAGGTSTGLLQAATDLGLSVDLLAINHWEKSVATHAANHPNARHLCESIERIIPAQAVPSGRLALLAASPECTHHSNAAAGRPRSDQSRATAWHVCRWAADLTVDNIFVENVAEFQNWGPLDAAGRPIRRRRGETFQAFVQALRCMGYRVEYRLQNAADFGDATSRRRLILMARRGDKRIVWPEPSHGTPTTPHRTARDIIDWTLKGRPISGRTRPLSATTLRRVEAGLQKFGGSVPEPFLILMEHRGSERNINRPLPTITTARCGAIALCSPFLIKFYGTADSPASVEDPLATVTTKDRFLLVEPTRQEIFFRMLQPHELAAAMSFPPGYKFCGTKTDTVKMIGNAVPVQLARAHCAALLDASRVAPPRLEQAPLLM